MKIVKLEGETKLVVENIKGFMKRKIVISGTSAKANCPKEYLGCNAYLVILENGSRRRGKISKRKSESSK